MDSPTEPERKDSRLYLIICAAAVVLAYALLIVSTSLPLHHCDVTEFAHELASAAVALFVITGLLSVLGATGAGGLRGWFGAVGLAAAVGCVFWVSTIFATPPGCPGPFS